MTLQPPQPSRHSPTDSKERNYQQIKVRQDTNENWLKNNPKPASGEWCYSIGPLNNPTTRNPAANDPPASKEWYGKFCVDADRNIWECTATSDGSNLVYSWQPVLEEGENVKYTPPASEECVKIGTSYDRWSQLPWLGGRGPKGSKGDPGDGIRIVGVLADCGPPTAEQAPNPEIGDMWIVSCEDRTGSSDCMKEGCDGTGWVWDGERWLPIGSIQGPPGNNVEYYYQEFAAVAGQTEFQLDGEVQVQATFVTINGVILLPNDYTFEANADGDVLKFLNDIPLKDEDIIMVFSFKGAIDAAVRTLTTADISTLGVRPTELPPVAREGIRNQQQVNWYLMDAVDGLEETVGGTLEDYATQEWVLDQSYITEQVVVDAVQVVVDDQKAVDEAQDREIEQIESRVSQIESVSLDAKYLYEADDKVPRDGEFTCLKNNGTEVTNEWADTQMLYFAENAIEGKPDWDHVTPNDVIRIGGSSTGIILPTELQSRQPDTFAEFKVISLPGERLFEVELIRSSAQPMAGVEYGVLLLSSFDPSGLATTDYVNGELAKKFDKSGGSITGTTSVEGGNFSVKNQEFRVKNGADENAFRIQPESQVTFNIPARMSQGIRLSGGAGNQFIRADSGVTGKLLYDKADQTEEEKQRFSWGSNSNYCWVPLDMKDNCITHMADPDPDNIHAAVTVNYLNQAIGSIDVGVGDAALDANQTWTGTNTFKGLTHVESSVISKAGTVLELKGDSESVQNRYLKLRGNADFRIYAYPGDNNNSSKNCMSILMKPDDTFPTVTLNYLVDPTSAGNPVNLRYANNTYLKIEDYALKPVVYKCDQYVKGCVKNIPGSGELSGMHNTAEGSATSANNYWGNVNIELRVHRDKLLDKNGNNIASGYRQSVAGYVTLIGKDNKMYLKAAIRSVVRPSGQDYIEVVFDNRTKPFGTGSYDSCADGYIVIIEGYEQ